ncbi:Probable transcriptional regulatory, LuxR family [Laribacter hongkongensis HLHK9]|uniref:Probable transcriptional regulatory, LuxR family n=1 Tax=Laribacter hongkongensis (strain HLHK9) TaxID=557598 RepID=C1D8M5_LARHH|nr:response regulator [Laribacter hongkongensis]ACO74815.1 Probable transcriptional regulatory, LuxR family [Laribacter hongkongensis HLHK9]
MMQEANHDQTVIIVDDDDAVREALSWLLEGNGFTIRVFDSGESLLAASHCVSTAGCLVLDVRLSGISGLILFERLRALGDCPPAIFLTGHADVPLAVSALKMGAADFFEKPFDDARLIARVAECLAADNQQRQARQHWQRIDAALQQLTEREHEVMQLIVAGRLNKQIAEELDISIKTVEVHRSRVLDKMGVKSAVELAGLLGRRERQGEA